MTLKTVADILQQVYRTYEGDIDYPEFDDDETQYYFALLKDGIDEWLNRFPEYQETFTGYPSTDSDVVEVTRPLFIVNYILNILVAEDDEEAAKKHVAAMNEQERLERVALGKNSDSPDQLETAGAGFEDTGSSVVDIVTGE